MNRQSFTEYISKSCTLHAVILLALVLGLAPLAESIPAVLAGILLKVGWDIIDWGYLRRLAVCPATQSSS